MSRILAFLAAGAPTVALAPASPEVLVARYGFASYLPTPILGTSRHADAAGTGFQWRSGITPAPRGEQNAAGVLDLGYVWDPGVTIPPEVATYRVHGQSIELVDGGGTRSWPVPRERTWAAIARSPVPRSINFVAIDGIDAADADLADLDLDRFRQAALAGRVVAGYVSPTP